MGKGKQNFINSTNFNSVTDETTKKMVIQGVTSIYCENHEELVPEFDKANCEEKIQGNHNSFIILGRDRPGDWKTGAGGKGDLQCGMIDIVVGRGQAVIANNKKKKKAKILEGVEKVGPMFHSDAARIYITQRALNIDQYFGLRRSGGKTSINKSAVAMKADHIRVIGREKVRIYCGRGNWEGFETGIGETNSLGERLSGQVIELQVGNQELHPMVLGKRLVDYLRNQQKVNRKVYKQLMEINLQLSVMNTTLGILTAGVPMFPKFAADDVINFAEAFTLNLNSILQTINYLDNDLIPGKNHILSNSVFTT